MKKINKCLLCNKLIEANGDRKVKKKLEEHFSEKHPKEWGNYNSKLDEIRTTVIKENEDEDYFGVESIVFDITEPLRQKLWLNYRELTTKLR